MIDDMQQGAQALVEAGLVDDSQICYGWQLRRVWYCTELG